MKSAKPAKSLGRPDLRLASSASPVEVVVVQDAEVSRKGFRKKREDAVRNFVAVAPAAHNAAILLECIYTAHLLRKRNRGFRTGLLVHPANVDFARASGAFDAVFAIGEARSLRTEILDLRPDILYSPDPNWRSQLSTLFTGAAVRIGGMRSRLIARLFRIYDLRSDEDLARLEQRGLQLVPEPLVLNEPLALPSDVELPEVPFVWLSLFDDHGVSGHWPVGHGARLVRLLETAGFPVVVPVPAERAELEKEIDYLRRSAPGVRVVEAATAGSRAAGMARAAAVVAPAGAETLLSSMVGSSVVMLHDMRSYGRARGLKLVDGATEREARTGKRRGESVLIRWVDSLERHIRPSVEECISDCPACSFNSCMEYISPERVFENLKKVLLPF